MISSILKAGYKNGGTIMSYSNYELYKWFNKFTHIKLEQIIEDAQENGKLNYKECGLIRTLASYSRRGDKPTTKQIEYAMKIIEKYNNESVNTNEEMQYAATLENNEEKLSNGISHLTVRIAWHDNKWNGKICNNPEQNDYCIGEHSLLSERLRTRRNTSLECKMCNYDLDKALKEKYQPPCFWGINTFGNISAEIEHDNPAAPKVTHIKEKLPPYSVFTWPFKLSFVREKSDEQKYGKYYPDRIFENRISHFQSKFKEKKSIVFLYSNYDNPVSGDEQKYLVVGCALMKDRGEKQYFDIHPDELVNLRKRSGAQNFPTMNWALRYSLDFPDNGVLLPYHEYLELEENNQNGDKELLGQIKVTIDEPELISGFKYVAMDIGNDQSIYILTKIKRSLLIIKEHNLVDYDVDNSLTIIDDMLRNCWNQRGHFPGFSNLARAVFDIRQNEKPILDELVYVLQENEGKKYYDKLIEMIEGPDSIDERYDDFEDLLYDLCDAIEEHDLTPQDFLRLAMLDLTYEQFKRIVNGSSFSLKEVCENPYVLYEEYIPSTITENAINGDVIDGNIDLYKIDIAYFPISDYIKKIRKLQNIKVDDPRRIRALIISILNTLEGKGDCYEEADVIMDKIKNYPLFYKVDSELNFKKDLRNLDDKYIDHLVKKITIKKDKNCVHSYFYLNEIIDAEVYIKNTIKNIIDLSDNNDLNENMSDIVDESAEKLSKRLKDRFDKETYISEHSALYSNIFRKRLFVLTGSPGSGKSHELLKVITKLQENYRSYLLLTPTGKAALRLKTDPEFKNIKVMTIDKYINDDDEDNMLYENIIIDEMSMVDLIKFKELLQKLNLKPTNFKRLILVGDPHQLPPISYGKVFVDIINFINSENRYRNNHVSLTVNCRQETDTMILDLANVFSDKNKNFEEVLSRLKTPGKLSSGLFIDFWKNRNELQEKIISHFKFLFERQYGAGTGQLTTIIDNLLGFDNSEKNYKSNTTLNLDAFQILSPYRSGFFGTLGLNNYLQNSFRTQEKASEVFGHGDKIILTKNVYEKGKLVVSNGSIGLAVKNGYKVKQYFPEYGSVRKFDSEKLELGYAITVHKSQGSGFNHVFVVIPNKRALLSKELLYTALTRSRNSLSIFIYQDNVNDVVDLFEEIRNRSYISHRRTSVFQEPSFNDTYLPADGISVKSRVEYIIYKKLEHYQNTIGGFSFRYEEVYELNNGKFDIKPDFTIELLSGRKIYWEHLGKLTDKSYVRNWKKRVDIYKQKGELGNLITTDELSGISDEKVSIIIEDILHDNIRGDGDNIWYSKYHYSLN